MSLIGHNSQSGPPVTAEAVREAFTKAKEGWSTPSQHDCETLAGILNVYRVANDERRELLDRKPNAAGRSRIKKYDEVRKAIGILLRDLPDLVAHSQMRLGESSPLHVGSLASLLEATKYVSVLWPDLDGRARKFDPRSDWARPAECLVGMMLGAWQRANPQHPIGLPKKVGQPATTLIFSLLAMTGCNAPSEEALAKHFERETSAFGIFELNRRTFGG